MEMDEVLTSNIIMNMDIKELYLLYQTSKDIRNMINQKYIMLNLLKKYQSRYLDYKWGYYDFIDLIWEQLTNHIDFENNVYLKDEILSAGLIIINRYLNSGDKITVYCDYKHEHIKNEWICHASYFLMNHGFKSIINQIYDELDDIYDKTETNKIYKNWLKLLKIKLVSYYISDDNRLVDTNQHDYFKIYYNKLYERKYY
jgi:hypothetical protein